MKTKLSYDREASTLAWQFIFLHQTTVSTGGQGSKLSLSHQRSKNLTLVRLRFFMISGSAWANAVWQRLQGRLAKANLGEHEHHFVLILVRTPPRWGGRTSSATWSTGQRLRTFSLEKLAMECQCPPDKFRRECVLLWITPWEILIPLKDSRTRLLLLKF